VFIVRSMPSTIDNAGTPLQIFETHASYLRHSKSGYWGKPTSSIDWCEHNYAVSFYIAEYYNTITNIGFILVGLFGAIQAYKKGIEFRFVLCYICTIMIGIGSALFHGTLTHVGQQGDETPMMLFACTFVICLIFLKPSTESIYGKNTFNYSIVSAVVFALSFAVLHWHYRFVLVFQGLIGVGAVGCAFLIRPHQLICSNPKVQMLGWHYYVGGLVFAFFLWQLDVHFCEQLHQFTFNPQFHAWWHFGCSIHCYSGTTFLIYQRQIYLGKKKPILKYFMKVLPYVDFLEESKE